MPHITMPQNVTDVMLILYRQRAQRHELLSGILIPLLFAVTVLPLYPRLSGFPSQTTLEHLTNAMALSWTILISITWYADRKKKGSTRPIRDLRDNLSKPPSGRVIYTIFALIQRALGLLLPFFAASELGGVTVAFSLLLLASSGLEGLLGRRLDRSTLRTAWKFKFTLIMILLATLFHYTYLRPANKRSPCIWGYLALYLSILVLPSPLLPSSPASKPVIPTINSQPPRTPLDGNADAKLTYASSLVKTPVDVELSKTTAYALFAVWMILNIFQHGISLAWLDGILTLISGTAAIVASELWARPKYLRTPEKYGVAAGCTCIAIFGIFLSLGSGAVPLLFAGLIGLGYAATRLDKVYSNSTLSQTTSVKYHLPKHQPKKSSKLTKYLLSRTTRGSILHSILRERDSRRIAYFAW
jgi:solute carrier family 30 (zinc transporter), member 5/7